MTTFLSNLNRPYPQQQGFKGRVITAAVFGVFVFLFLFVFQPFQLDTLGDRVLAVSLGYGATTFVIMLLLNVGIPGLIPGISDEGRWTVLHELLWTLLNIFSIAVGNLLYSNFLGITSLSFGSFILFSGYTLSV